MTERHVKVSQGNEPKDWKRGQEKARRARASVADQVTEMLIDRDTTGGRALFARRLSQLARAERGGDRTVVRAAVMEVALAALQWCVNLDLRQR